MTQKISLLTLVIKAAGTIGAHTFVGTDNKTAVEGADAQGVATFDAVSGDQLSIDVLGTTIVKVDTDVAAGARVAVGASGGVKPIVAGAIPVGRALEAGAAGARIEVMLFQGAAAAA